MMSDEFMYKERMITERQKILVFIYNEEMKQRDIIINNIAKGLSKQHSSIGLMLKELEEWDLIRKSKKGRSTLIELTPKGKYIAEGLTRLTEWLYK